MALLISLFALLLICIVGVALILASGTDSALTGNYHSATSVYYAALAGLEEGRGRMLPKAANYLPTALGLPAGAVPGLGQVWYILNPLPGEVVTPWDNSAASLYPDNEYAQEFGAPVPTAAPSLQWSNSVFTPPTLLLTPGPIYKWVRIAAVTFGSQQSMGVTVNQGPYTPTTPILYANGRLDADPVPGGAPAALEITSLAAMPNGSKRMLQYVVAPITYNLSFPSAMTLEAATTATFTGPASTPALTVDGTDTLALPPCIPGATPAAGIGIAGAPPTVNIGGVSVLPTPIPPPAAAVTLSPNLQTASSLQTLVQMIKTNADIYKTGPQTSGIFPAMSGANPITIAVDGDLDMSTFTGQGFGILLVTGTLTYNPAASWSGIILVIGQGNVISTGTGGGQIAGAVLVAQIVPGVGLLPPSLGQASWQASGGASINYSSCWANVVQTATTYKILSFREIPQ